MSNMLTNIVLSKHADIFEIFAASFTQNCEHSLIVVDDGLPDKSKQEWPDFEYIESPKPFAFCLSVNAGIERTPPGDVIIWNDDCIIKTEAADSILQKVANSKKKIGLAAPIMCNVQNEDQWPENRVQRKFYTITSRNISFTCVLITVATLSEVGVLDPGFAVGIGGAEDRDYCVRVREAGFLSAIAQTVYVQHGGPEFGRAISNTRFKEGQLDQEKKNREYFNRKYGISAGA